jgi:hypothetical protein
MSLRGPRPKRDSAKFRLEMCCPDTRHPTKIVEIIGTEKAEKKLLELNRSLKKSDLEKGCKWQKEPCSSVGRIRSISGFRPN